RGGLEAGPVGAGGGGGGRGGAGSGGGRGGGPAVRVTLAGEPVALTTLAAGTDELAPRAAAVVAKLDWPGKPAPVVEVPRLTAEEQARFDAGSELYRNLCIAYHQPDGQGREMVCPALVGSPLLLSDPGGS